MRPEVSILVLAHNKAEYTRRCLASLFHSTLRPFQVVLVDNGSTDAIPEIFASFKSKADQEEIQTELITLSENRGAIVGRNLGMEKMCGDYWVFIDNDITVRTASWLETFRAILDQEKDIGVVGPKLVYPKPPHKIQCAGCTVTTQGQVTFNGRGCRNDDPGYQSKQDCQTLISACWMMRRSVYEKIGPLDEQFSPVQFEDIDYCYRIREAGWRCVYTPSVEMYHFENVTSGRTGTLNYPYLTVKNGLKFKRKWKHCFEKEGGPEAWTWADIPFVQFEDVPENLPLL